MTTLLKDFDHLPPSGPDLLDLFLATKEAENCRERTVSNYRETCTRFLTLPGLPPQVAAWRDDHIILWLAGLRRTGLAESSVAFHQRHVYVWLGWLHEHGDLPADIRRRVKRVHVTEHAQRSMTYETLSKMLRVVADNPPTSQGNRTNPEHRLRNLAFLLVLWSTGVRRNELSNVNLDDVDLRRGEMLVRKPKGKRERIVPFDAPTKKALLEYITRERGSAPGALFLSRGGERMSSQAMLQVLRRVAARAGVQASSHDFRRGFAARVRASGLDLGHTAQLLGHSTLTMSLRYSRAGEADAAIDAYRRLVG